MCEPLLEEFVEARSKLILLDSELKQMALVEDVDLDVPIRINSLSIVLCIPFGQGQILDMENHQTLGLVGSGQTNLVQDHLFEEIPVQADVDGKVAEIPVLFCAIDIKVQIHVQQPNTTLISKRISKSHQKKS